MKIIMCTRDLQIGGAGTHIRLLLHGFDKSSDIEKVLVIGPNKLKGFGSKIQFRVLRTWGHNFITREPYYAIACRNKIEKIIKKEDYDFIHTHFSFLTRDFEIPLVATIHSLNYFMIVRNLKITPDLRIANFFHRIYELFDKKTIANSSQVIFVSNNALKQAVQRYRDYNQRFIHIPNFIDINSFYPYKRVEKKKAIRKKWGLSVNLNYFLFVGRLEPLKGVVNLIRAFEEFHKNYNNFRLILTGEGMLRDFVSRFDFVINLGKVQYTSMNEIYNLADYFVLPSLYENFPMTILEAMGCGLPVIATDVGDVKEILADDRMIIQSPTVEDIKEKLELLASLSGEELFKIGMKNRKRVEDLYSCERNIPLIINTYQSIRDNKLS